MPSTELSDGAKEAMTAAETAEVLLNLLTITYDGTALLRVHPHNRRHFVLFL